MKLLLVIRFQKCNIRSYLRLRMSGLNILGLTWAKHRLLGPITSPFPLTLMLQIFARCSVFYFFFSFQVVSSEVQSSVFCSVAFSLHVQAISFLFAWFLMQCSYCCIFEQVFVAVYLSKAVVVKCLYFSHITVNNTIFGPIQENWFDITWKFVLRL